MKIIKKNQLTILVIALMIITAGYLNYNAYSRESIPTSSNSIIQKEENLAGIGDAKLVYSNETEENENVDLNSIRTENNEKSILDTIAESLMESNLQENKQEEKINKEDEYFVKSRLERETMYSETLEIYKKLLENPNISNEQKSIAQKEIDNINKTKNAIMISENLIKTKGIEECLVYVNDNSINVIVHKDELLPEDIAQIQNVISRELKAEIENIHITKK